MKYTNPFKNSWKHVNKLLPFTASGGKEFVNKSPFWFPNLVPASFV